MIFADCFWTVFLLICSVQSHKLKRFPSNFKFGSATSAYQIEGAWNTDGKGENIWDHLTHKVPGIVYGQHNGDVATNSYHRYKEDVQMLKDAEMDFYRFSISWSRVLPNGNTSVINEAGLQYYDNLINELLANGIEPLITIYHWDLPQPIQDQGGLNSPSFVTYFEQYADVLFARFHDRVSRWITFNEPIVFCNYIYIHPNPPYINTKTDISPENYQCAHNVLLANAKVYDLYKRKYAKAGDQIGITLVTFNSFPKDPKNPSDVAAADRYLQFNIGAFAHPIFSQNGDYPKVMRDIVDAKSKLEGRATSRLPVMTDEERILIKGKADFLGLNYYSSRFFTEPNNCKQCADHDEYVEMSIDPSWPKGKSWFMYSVPEGLRALLNWIRTEYNNPEVKITENGWSDDGELYDVGRIKYLQGHLNATLNAINDGCNVTAYTTWSIIDNFEWLFGYSEAFGLYHVDFNATELTRTPKASVGFLREVIKSRSIPEDYWNLM